MNTEHYRAHMTAETLMGPNCVRILEELLLRHPLKLNAEDIVLDLGCGKGLTSLVLAKETGAKVFASDLWTPAQENEKRFVDWGVGERVTPFQENADSLQFEKGLFRALVSVDAYHYFATEHGFFAEKILPFLGSGAEVLIGVPGVKEAYSVRSEELLRPWLRDEAYMFKSPQAWKAIIGSDERIAFAETWEMACFDTAWGDWLAMDQPFARGDSRFFDTIIRPYTCFAGIYVRLK